jgi:citrate lyase beta subunit
MSDIRSVVGVEAPIRSLLFVPASRIDRVQRARASAANAVIIDLEDAVAEREKPAARAALAQYLRNAPDDGCPVFVRINALSTPHAREDLETLRDLPVHGIVVPKAEPGGLAALTRTTPIIAIVETAAGVRGAFDIAQVEGVTALMIGTLDLAAELGAQPDEDDVALQHAASVVVLDSAAAGLTQGPIDGALRRASPRWESWVSARGASINMVRR